MTHFKALAEKVGALRKVLGRRGDISTPARLELGPLLRPTEGAERNDLVMLLSEIGGSDIALGLMEVLREDMASGIPDETYEMHLVSALSRIGGPEVIERLLRVAETGSERVQLCAISGLEDLTTAGTIALTEPMEPATISSQAMFEAYSQLAQRLEKIVLDPRTNGYVRHKANELLQTTQLSLVSYQP